MYTRRSEWEDEKGFTEKRVTDMELNNYNNLLTSGRWSNKDPKDSQILDLLVVAQKLADYSNR